MDSQICQLVLWQPSRCRQWWGPRPTPAAADIPGTEDRGGVVADGGTMDTHSKRSSQGMQAKHYRSLGIMALLSFVAMYALMYVMVDRLANVHNNLNQACCSDGGVDAKVLQSLGVGA